MWPFARLFVAATTIVSAASEEGHTGTHGGVESTFEGVRFSIDSSVGPLSDPTQEAAALATRQAEARGWLAAVEPERHRMERHFRSGRHPYRASADSLVGAIPAADEPLERRSARARITVKVPPSEDLLRPEPERAPVIVAILALVSSDARRPTEVAALRAFAQERFPEDDRLDAWLAEIAALPSPPESP